MKDYTLEQTVDVLLNFNILAERPVQWSRDNIRELHTILNQFDFYGEGVDFAFDPVECEDDFTLVHCTRKFYECPQEVVECAFWELDISIDAKKAA